MQHLHPFSLILSAAEHLYLLRVKKIYIVVSSMFSFMEFFCIFFFKLDFFFLVSVSQPPPGKVSPHAGFKLSIEMQTLLG